MIDTRTTIDKLLDRAASTTFPAEREVCLAKVAELRAKAPPPPPPSEPPRTMVGTPDPEPRWVVWNVSFTGNNTTAAATWINWGSVGNNGWNR